MPARTTADRTLLSDTTARRQQERRQERAATGRTALCHPSSSNSLRRTEWTSRSPEPANRNHRNILTHLSAHVNSIFGKKRTTSGPCPRQLPYRNNICETYGGQAETCKALNGHSLIKTFVALIRMHGHVRTSFMNTLRLLNASMNTLAFTMCMRCRAMLREANAPQTLSKRGVTGRRACLRCLKLGQRRLALLRRRRLGDVAIGPNFG